MVSLQAWLRLVQLLCVLLGLLALFGILLRGLAAAALGNDSGGCSGRILGTGNCRLRALRRRGTLCAADRGLTSDGGTGSRRTAAWLSGWKVASSRGGGSRTHDQVGTKNLQEQARGGCAAQR